MTLTVLPKYGEMSNFLLAWLENSVNFDKVLQKYWYVYFCWQMIDWCRIQILFWKMRLSVICFQVNKNQVSFHATYVKHNMVECCYIEHKFRKVNTFSHSYLILRIYILKVSLNIAYHVKTSDIERAGITLVRGQDFNHWVSWTADLLDKGYLWMPQTVLTFYRKPSRKWMTSNFDVGDLTQASVVRG